jgi:hypothetical protein
MGAEYPGKRYYRLGLGAAKRRDLAAALGYAKFALLLDPEHEGAIRLAELCRIELGEEPALSRIAQLVAEKKWKAAAVAAKGARQNVRLLAIQGCLWALAKRSGPAADCFAQALARDRGNALAAEALAELGRKRSLLGGLFVSFR